jgi:hypothetical protein
MVAVRKIKIKIVRNKNRAKDLRWWCVFLVFAFPFRCKDCSLQEISWRLSLAFLFFFKGFLKLSFGFVIFGIGFCLVLFFFSFFGFVVGHSWRFSLTTHGDDDDELFMNL